MASTPATAVGVRRELSSKVLQMKFMQRAAAEEHNTAAALSHSHLSQSAAVAQQWSAPPASSSFTAPTASTATHIRIVGCDEDDTTPPAFIAGRRSFGRNKALERTLEEIRARQAGQTATQHDTRADRGQDARENEEEDEEEKEDPSRRWGGGRRSDRRSEGGVDGDRGRHSKQDSRNGDGNKRRATMSVTDIGREKQWKKKHQRLRDGSLRPASAS